MKQTIMQAIQFSKMAYWEFDKIQNTIKSQGFEHVYTFENIHTDTQGFIVIDPKKKEVWITFRGTTDFKDWLTNFNIATAISPYGTVHRGFYSNALSIKRYILTTAERAQFKDYKIIYTGHSQGAAIATQLFINDALFRNKICIPIESPRSCLKDSAALVGKLMGNSIWPIVHNNDIVRRVPPRSMGYRHITNTNIQYINRNGVVKNNLPWYSKMYDHIMGFIKEPVVDCIADHDLATIEKHWANYIKTT